MKYSLPREVAGWNAKDVHLKPKQSRSSFTRWNTLTNRTKKSPKWHTCCVQRRSDDWHMFGKAGELILSLILPYFTRHSSASGTTSVTRSREDCRRHEPSRKTWLLCWEEEVFVSVDELPQLHCPALAQFISWTRRTQVLKNKATNLLNHCLVWGFQKWWQFIHCSFKWNYITDRYWQQKSQVISDPS